MRRVLVGSVVLATFVFVPLVVTAQQKGKEGKSTQATPQDYSLLASRYTQVDGKFVSGDATKIVVSIEHPHAVRNTSTTTRRTSGVTVQHDHIEFELPVRDKAVIKKAPGVGSGGFDAAGNPKGATADPAAKKSTTPGTIDIADIAAGSVIRLQLDAPKKSATSKDAEADPLSTHSGVRTITVIQEPGAQMAADGKKKKNNN
jgi:hypothetical protein